jgi:Zn-dependent protease
MSYNPFYEPLDHRGPPRVAFSRTELLHLAVAVVALTAAFSMVLGPHQQGQVPRFSVRTVLTAFFAVATGFVLHELAHKVLAQRYGHWAEFRAQFGGLGLTLLFAALVKFLFAAPGAVLIQGRVTPRENGLISLVGPGMNLLIAGICYPLAWSTDTEALRPTLFAGIAEVNSVLCLFNLVPLGPLDGRKVLAWSKMAYLAAVAVAIGMFVMVILSPNGPPL